MDDTIARDSAQWAHVVARARQELAALPEAQRDWLTTQVNQIAQLQGELDHLFRAIDGPAICTACHGDCCSRAKHHLTLTNVLAYLLAGEAPPEPDYALPCPLLGPRGCRLPVARRPFTCVIFFCDLVDRELLSEQRQAFSEIEAKLRAAYQLIAAQCPGASLRGLLIAATRLGDRPLLSNLGG